MLAQALLNEEDPDRERKEGTPGLREEGEERAEAMRKPVCEEAELLGGGGGQNVYAWPGCVGKGSCKSKLGSRWEELGV